MRYLRAAVASALGSTVRDRRDERDPSIDDIEIKPLPVCPKGQIPMMVNGVASCCIVTGTVINDDGSKTYTADCFKKPSDEDETLEARLNQQKDRYA